MSEKLARYRSAAASLGMVLGLVAIQGCSTSKVAVPGLNGPSELGLALNPTATPDELTADGASTSAIQVTVKDQNGHTVTGQGVLFQTYLDGQPVNLGALSSTTAVTGPDGTAQVVYTAPYRTDFTATGHVDIAVRPIGTDFNGQIYRFVTIELLDAVGHQFLQLPSTVQKAPICKIVAFAPNGFLVGQSILLSPTVEWDPTTPANDQVVRYFWTFGDDSPPSDETDVNHVYKNSGAFDVTLTLTDLYGEQFSCDQAVVITSS